MGTRSARSEKENLKKKEIGKRIKKKPIMDRITNSSLILLLSINVIVHCNRMARAVHVHIFGRSIFAHLCHYYCTIIAIAIFRDHKLDTVDCHSHVPGPALPTPHIFVCRRLLPPNARTPQCHHNRRVCE